MEYFKNDNNVFPKELVPEQDKRKFQVIPFSGMRYNPEDYQTIPESDVTVVEDSASDQDNTRALEVMLHTKIKNNGVYCLSPFAYNPNDIPNIYSLLATFKRFSNNISLASARIDAIARDSYIASIIKYFGAVKLTIAVEGISQRIRNFLDKSLNTEELLTGLAHAIEAGFSTLKIYMIYTGYETEEDLKEFETFLKKLDDLRCLCNKPTLQIRFSFTPLLSTMMTPIQYAKSQIGKQIRSLTSPLYKISQICNRYNFGVRMSSTIPAAEFAQIVEFGDRRFASLFLYAGVNGITPQNRFTVQFYRGERAVSKSEYEKASSNKLAIPDPSNPTKKIYYLVDFLDTISSSKYYIYLAEHHTFEDVTLSEITETFLAFEGKECPEQILENIPVTRRNRLRGCRIHVTEYPSTELVFKYSGTSHPSNQIYRLVPESISQISVDTIKKLLPVATNGVTYNDIISEKDPLYIFPQDFARFHETRHQASNLRRYMHNLAGLYNIHCLGDGRGCQQCSKCTSPSEIHHIQSYTKELGSEHYRKIKDTVRDTEVSQKIYVIMNVQDGVYSAMSPEYLVDVGRSVLLRAVNDVRFTKAVVSETMVNHSRSHYQIKSDSFKSMISGLFVHEVYLNKSVRITQSDLDSLLPTVQQNSIPGVNILGLKLVDKEQILKTTLQDAFIEFRFDSRKVSHVDLSLLREKIAQFYDSEVNIKYKQQVSLGRGQFSVNVVDLDKSKIKFLQASLGSTKYEVVLRVLMSNIGIHPLIFLAGFLGTKNKVLSYNSLYGTQIRILGFYSAQTESDSVFNAGDSEFSNVCTECGKPRILNVLTGKPFGSIPQEQVYNHSGICHECFSKIA